MKLAIQVVKRSFSDRWIEYCQQHSIEYKTVDVYRSDIIEQLADCDALMWHYTHTDYRDTKFAKELLASVEASGKFVFPNYNTGWYFDDKLAQKYLLEAINVPLVPTHVFYDKKEALYWAESTDYPKVFKLRGGAGSMNVLLVKNQSQARHYIRRAFGRGFKAINRVSLFKDHIQKILNGIMPASRIIKALGYLVYPLSLNKYGVKEVGYALFQDFIPNNNCDIRIIVIGERAFAIKRITRDDDFRASGSGKILYDREEFDIRCVKIAFEVNQTLKSQCIAYDFIFDIENNPLIVEISYGFVVSVYDACPGYWDKDLNWHPGKFIPQHWMIENLIADVKCVKP